ncbi:MAG TPA: penicillin-binding protein [Candidatus Fimiplasma intestinipullorum]|uniref:Penicillin-binding protein n=1 Tax=Candidatus Fimiplasma intestinipullorum TaxID=2840825 RepID=A0A9D1L0I0_9FIRM|nr:penicillin-binding protein [Candidatus Fimiplasma intestinipullorum]
MSKNTIYSKIFLALFLFCILLMVFNILYLAGTGKHLISGEDIASYAKNNRSETIQKIKADRGSIYSYDGELLVSDRTAYNVTAYISDQRQGVGDTVAYVDNPDLAAKILAPYVNQDESTVYARLTTDGLWQTTFKCYLNSVEKQALEEELKANNINGIEFDKTATRSYMYKHFSSYLLGLVNTNDDDPTNVVRTGAFGIEAAYEEILAGQDGRIVYQADSDGHAISGGVISEYDAVNGDSIYLSLDSELQNMLETKLDEAMEKSGASKMWCGFMDAHTGRMLAMASRPDFDLTDRSSLENWTDLFLTYAYEVGSVAKPFVYMTAIDQGVYDGSATYQSGTIKVNGTNNTVRDWNYGQGWGTITFDEGLVRSSNTAIVTLLQDKVDFDDYTNRLKQLGFFQSTTIDGLSVAGGVAAYESTDSPYDKVSIGFGQASTYSPIQILKAYSVFANDGRTVEPYFVDRIVKADGTVSYSATGREYSDQIFSSEAVAHVSELMTRVINDEIGTGKTYQSDEVLIMGKTGTGQLYDSSTGTYSSTAYTYTFAGTAPADDPQVVVFIGMEGPDNSANSTYLAEVVKALMPQAVAKVSNTSTNTTTTTSEVTLDSYVNQSTDFARTRLEQTGLNYVIIGDGQSIKKQSPAMGTTVSSASTVYLLTDASSYALPDFTGWSRKDVASYMQLFDIPISFSGTGNVKSQDVAPGTNILEMTELVIELDG